ncbi:MFS transporter [Phenylobacterium sp.]|uniref:MFS transporter n=1 Tax=Phenylobacterium sp. TaxID=1871053 RepID=UPI00286A963A|nr:MFS transporter [Phenylobacterium sp.]
MSFFGNDAINRVNLQSGVQALAEGAGGLFLLVFLLRAGIAVPIALLAQAAIVAVRFVVRPALLPLAQRFGLKPLLLAGAVGMAAQYPVLAGVHEVGPRLAIFCLVAALAEVAFYVSKNAYVAVVGDTEHRGHQVAVGQSLAAAASVVAPLAGAWGLVAIGPTWTFSAVALVQVASAVPLLGLPNVTVSRSAPGAWRAARPAALLLAVDGWFDASFIFAWQVALFLALRESYAAYGGVMALAGFVGAAAGLLIGRHVDRGGGRRAVLIAYGAAGAIVLLRAGSLGSPWFAGVANAAGGLVMPLLVPPLGAAAYNLAKASPCPFRNKMASEGGWDVGCFMTCLVAAGLAQAGAPSWSWVLLALPAAGLGGRLLWPYFPRA